jgi:hypothetical protein
MNVGVRPTGPGGTYTRQDHLREAGYAFVTAVLLVTLILADGALVNRFNDGRLDGLYAGVFVAAWLGALLAAVACVAYLLQAALARKRPR